MLLILRVLLLDFFRTQTIDLRLQKSSIQDHAKALVTDYYQISSSLSISGVNLGIPKASLAGKWEEMATSIKRGTLLGAGKLWG